MIIVSVGVVHLVSSIVVATNEAYRLGLSSDTLQVHLSPLALWRRRVDAEEEGGGRVRIINDVYHRCV